jgi:TonB family protein
MMLGMGLLLAAGAAAFLLRQGPGSDGGSSVFVPADEAVSDPANAEPAEAEDEPVAVSPPEPTPSSAAPNAAAPNADAPNADAPTIMGNLPQEVITRVVRQHAKKTRDCYEQGLSNNPKLSGRVNVRFAIHASGHVMMASSKDSTLGDAEVERCVVEVFRGMSFPRSEGGTVAVTYPVDFKAQ